MIGETLNDIIWMNPLDALSKLNLHDLFEEIEKMSLARKEARVMAKKAKEARKEREKRNRETTYSTRETEDEEGKREVKRRRLVPSSN